MSHNVAELGPDLGGRAGCSQILHFHLLAGAARDITQPHSRQATVRGPRLLSAAPRRPSSAIASSVVAGNGGGGFVVRFMFKAHFSVAVPRPAGVTPTDTGIDREAFGGWRV